LGKALERHPFATATAVTLIAAAVELALQNQSAWVPALQATVDRLATQATTIFSRWRPDERPSDRTEEALAQATAADPLNASNSTMAQVRARPFANSGHTSSNWQMDVGFGRRLAP